MAGTLIEGAYRVLEPVGRGGMGLVLRARDERLDREVAIKIVRPESVGSAEEVQLFLKEARAMARVRHPNVVEIHAYGHWQGLPYFVMEYVPGTDLDALLTGRVDPLAVDEVLGILDQVCQGVAAIHAAGAVHRDLKHSNVLIGPAFRIAVADLGLVHAIDESAAEADGRVVGTPGFIAPEIAQRIRVAPRLGPRADVYALGVIAYELLTGRILFDAPDPLRVLELHCTGDPPRPSEVRPDLPSVFDDVVLAALAKDPVERTPSADQLRKALFAARAKLRRSYSAMSVLVVDDDADSRAYLGDVVEQALPGAFVDCQADGAAALAAAQAAPPSLVLLDLKMPGLNGVELVAMLRSLPQTRSTPVVVVTGCGDARDWKLLRAMGARGFVVKPAEPITLAALVRRLVQPGDELAATGS